MSAEENISPAQFLEMSARTGPLGENEYWHGTKAHRQIMQERRFQPSEEGSSGPGVYLTKDEGWAKEYGRPMRVEVDLEGANLGEVVTGQDELDMADDPSYDALVHRRSFDTHEPGAPKKGEPSLLVLRDPGRIRKARV